MKIEIILSIIAIVVSVITSAFNIVFETKNRKFRQKVFDYDVQKETTRQLEKRTDDIYTRLNSRSSLIPFFITSLNGSKAVYIENRKSIEITLFITLENIGLNSAVDIKFEPYGDKKNKIIKSKNDYLNNYFFTEKLSSNHCISNDKIYFILTRKVSSEKLNTANDFISFKIRFKDLLGNTYCQEHQCGYGLLKDKIAFSKSNYSSVPDLIEENIKIE